MQHEAMDSSSKILHLERLHPEERMSDAQVRSTELLAEMDRLRNTLQRAKEEIDLLIMERDELVEALRSWAAAPRGVSGPLELPS
jgi:chromosome segregation ATPase